SSMSRQSGLCTHRGAPSCSVAGSDHDLGMPDVVPDLSAPPGPVAMPRLIAPLSTSTVTQQRPTVRWTLGPGVGTAHVEFCKDRSCNVPLNIAAEAVDGTSARPAAPLPSGWVYWRGNASARGRGGRGGGGGGGGGGKGEREHQGRQQRGPHAGHQRRRLRRLRRRSGYRRCSARLPERWNRKEPATNRPDEPGPGGRIFRFHGRQRRGRQW